MAGITPWNLTSEKEMERNTAAGLKRLGILESHVMAKLGDEMWGAVDQCRAPFRVVPLEGLKAFGRLPRSSEGLGVLLSDLPEGASVVLVSHTWPSEDEADDAAGSFFSITVAGVEKLLEAKGWEASNVYVWTRLSGLDNDDSQNRAAGVEALLGYAALCDAMLIPCAEVPAQGAHTLDAVPGGYAAGAWARLEGGAFCCASALRCVLRPEMYVAAPGGFLQRFEFVMDEAQLPEAGAGLAEADRDAFRRAQEEVLGGLRAAMELRGSLARTQAGVSAVAVRPCLACAAQGNGCREGCGEARLVAAAGVWESGELLLLNTGTGTLRGSLKGHQGKVWCLGWSQDGASLASGGADKTVRLWVGAGWGAGGEGVVLEGHTGHVMSVAFSPDCLTLASGSSDKTIIIWDVLAASKGASPLLVKRATLIGHSDVVSSVAFSPDGATMASGSFDRSVRLWDVSTGVEREGGVLLGHGGFVCSVAWSPSGALLASAGQDKVIKVWDVEGHVVAKSLEGHGNTVSCLAFSPDGEALASGSADMTVRLWDVDAGTERLGGALRGHRGFVNALSFSPDGGQLITGSQEKVIKSWDLAGGFGAVSPPAGAGPNPILSVAVSKNGKFLATGSVDSTIKIYDTDKGEERLTLPGHQAHVTSVAWSSVEKFGEGLTLASGSFDCTIRLWMGVASSHEGVPVTCIVLRGHTHLVYCLAFSPSGDSIASGSQDRTVRLWDLAQGEGGKLAVTSKVLQGHSNTISSVAFSPDGSKLATASFDFSVRLWEIGAAMDGNSALLKGHGGVVYSVAFSPDGKMLASGSIDKTIRLWDVTAASQTPPSVKMCVLEAACPIFAVAFSPGGSEIASGREDSMVVLWSTASGTARSLLAGHSASINAVAYGSDGTLVSGCADGTTLVWREGKLQHVLLEWETEALPSADDRELAKDLRTLGVARQCSVGSYDVRAVRDRVEVRRVGRDLPLCTYTAPFGIYSLLCSGTRVLVGLADRSVLRLECPMLAEA